MKKPHALIADDSPTQLLLLSFMLDQLGYDITTATNGLEAVEAFDPLTTDVIFMDIEMPEMNGIEAIRVISKRIEERFIPIFFITGGNRNAYVSECVAVGGTDFIQKPFDADILSAKTQSLHKLKQLYIDQKEQKDKIEAFQRAQEEEQKRAAVIYKNIIKSNYMPSPNLTTVLSPVSRFNGDILLCAYTPGDKLIILLGDFTGHGITASLASSPAAEVFYSMASKGFSIKLIAEEINKTLKRLLPVNMFLAATLVCLDRDIRNLSIICCGLPDHFLFNHETGVITEISSQSLPLGIIDSQEMQLTETYYSISDAHDLIMFTDGVIETEDRNGTEFGLAGVRGCLTPSDPETLRRIEDALNTHQGQTIQKDDITLVQLSCNLSDSHWGLYGNADKNVAAEPSNWKIAFTFDYTTLKRLNPVPTLVNTLMEIQALLPHRETIFLVVTELFVNSLDHGLLRLDSSLKGTPEGFAEYFELKEKRLNQLDKGSIKLIMSHAPSEHGGKLTIRIRDSGPGFNYKKDKKMDANATFYGRGLPLIRQHCDSLEHLDNGSQAVAVYSWSNDDFL